MKPLTYATAKDTTRFLKDEVFLKYGVPEIIISDNGPQFKSEHFQMFVERYRVKHWRTANYHAQANATEAANKTILNAIKAYVEDIKDQINWDRDLAEIACAMNSSVHSSTGETPYRINFGHEMALDGEQYETLIDKNFSSETNKNKFEQVREKVRKNLRVSYEKSKRRYDLRAREIQYHPGDQVWLKNFKLSNAGNKYSAKLDHNFKKCIVVRKIGSNTYELSNEKGKILGNFSASDIKP